MSDTPRTEIYVLNPHPACVPAEFARDLERELARVVKQRQDHCDTLTKMRVALSDFDNAREANQWPNTGQARYKDADEFIERVRHILQNEKAQ